MHPLCGIILVEIVWIALLMRFASKGNLPYSNASRSVPRENDLRGISPRVLADELTSI